MVEIRQDPEQGLSHGFAGDTLNVATYLRRLLAAPDFIVDYVTAVGDDPLSQRMVAAWEAEGIGTSLVRRLSGELPGLYWIVNRADGEREFYYWRSTSAARRLLDSGDPGLSRILRRGDMLYLSAISLAILPPAKRALLLNKVAALREHGIRIAYDSNYRPRLWENRDEARAVHHRMLGQADVYLTSLQDESALLGERSAEEVAGHLTAAGVPEWVVRAEPGVTIASDAGYARAAAIAPEKVRDTTGAGDAFDAAYLSARLMGFDSATAIAAGHALAAVVVQHRGAIISAAVMPGFSALLAAAH